MKSLNGRHRKQTAVHNSAFMSTFDKPDVVHEVSHSFETHGWAEVDRRKRQASCTYMKTGQSAESTLSGSEPSPPLLATDERGKKEQNTKEQCRETNKHEKKHGQMSELGAIGPGSLLRWEVDRVPGFQMSQCKDKRGNPPSNEGMRGQMSRREDERTNARINADKITQRTLPT
ncbi:uncharacterized protein EDB93DRAFT_1109488 [Suillus bovinus]|uniref:uncharacterized protein n=1 Tax=Suillus bovinus TaxID=48563 RepID=UPI001B86484B|nr:uncharacterized protein EDB93DRAFT_1109488 [Suillus bovinus]KAG2126964.1 hypothetical protein EDB93DRAFT_1109488 [Suillus bovinus]